MKVAATLAIALTVFQAPASKTYEHTPSNIKFTLEGESKLVRKRGDWTITFPVDGKTATLNVFAISFTADAEVWEGTQKFFAEQQKLELQSLSREEILGVPLLLAKLRETATLDRNVTLSGIVYAATDWKFAFRLTAPEAIYASAETKWREALVSFATIDGRLPEPEKPGRATEASAGGKKPPVVPDRTRTPIGTSVNPVEAPFVIGDVQAKTVSAGREVLICGPSPFRIKAEGDAFAIEHDLLPGRAMVHVFSSLDSGTMSSTLTNRANKALDAFTIVRRRDETLPFANAAGAKVIRIAREGESSQGPMFAWLAGGEKSEFYWILEWVSNQKPDSSQAALLTSLLQGLSIEKAK